MMSGNCIRGCFRFWKARGDTGMTVSLGAIDRPSQRENV